MDRLRREPLSIALIYVLAGFLWIALSDRLVFSLVRDPQAQQLASTLKGWAYVALTGVALYVLMRRSVLRLQRVQAQAWQAQKMEALGRMAAAISHDMNNVLGAIQTTADLVKDELGPQHPQAAAMDQVEQATQRGRALVKQLMAFARQQPAEPAVLKLETLLRNSEPLLRKLLGPKVDLDLELGWPAPSVLADAVQLEQVLMNLVANANDAMPQGGQLRIGLQQQGRWAVLWVQDSGVGMDETVRSHIFEPFYTTKGPGVGTGLGLATVFGIIQQYDGEVSVSSQPGRGTRFEMRLPRLG